ncbi:spore germination protein [Ihubacter sp. rT4E-8]|uniref:spore germination protein n=1 Tax=unclassified Ihubacter TaxID=2633299 RepID=UPI00137ABD85
MSENKYQYFLQALSEELPLGESFDLDARPITIGGRHGMLYYVDGLSDGQQLQLLFNFLMALPEERMQEIKDADQFLDTLFPFIKSTAETDLEKVLKFLFSGLCPIVLDGLDKIIVADVRSYPQRSVAEPEKEKTLRGAKDGFTENFMDNLGLIRRRIRDGRLIFKNFAVGEQSRTDIALCYMKGIADSSLVSRLEHSLNEIKVNSVSIGDQTIVEQLIFHMHGSRLRGRFNPFPKVRYTQRPDIICAHLTEGKIAIVVDNSPTVILLPVGIFDFTQDVDDYYFPLITGNYLRLLRILNMLVILFLTPVYLLIAEGSIPTPFDMDFIRPKDPYALSIFWQFMLLELAIDGLKLASLNTPESLGTSLSVIGALILGEFSIDSGWFIPQTILMMAVVSLAAFTQPSIELSYGIKLIRVFMLIGATIGGVWGLVIALILGLLMVALTKTVSGRSYLYPLLPFKWKELKKLLFRTAK